MSDSLGVSTVGNRRYQKSNHHHRQHAAVKDQQQSQEESAMKMVQSMLKGLEHDSQFFESNMPYTLPNFLQSEIELKTPYLGKGEFGEVYAVSAIHVAEDCPCPKCQNDRVSMNDDNNNNNIVIIETEEEEQPQVTEKEETNQQGQEQGKIGAPQELQNATTSSSPSPRQPGPSSLRNGNDNKNQPQASSHPPSHRRLTSHISFAEDVKDDDASTLSTESDPDDFLSTLLNDNDDDNDTDGEAAFLRGYMSTHVQREGRSRYAIKRLRLPKHSHRRDDEENSSPNSSSDKAEYPLEAAMDLATEAKFLASIRHPNIVKMRGTVGKPGSLDFMILMDCLTMTLDDKMKLWNQEASPKNRGGKFGFLSQLRFGKNRQGQYPEDTLLQDQHGDKLLAVYDIARALKYLHNQFILFRDLKPENVAFDVRGDMRLFDFGLARELKKKDLEKAPDEFNLTGLTGSRRYMAPEVVQCKPYGLKADVYSYSILFWEVFSGQTAYPNMTLNQHFEHVILQEQRPNVKKVHGKQRALRKKAPKLLSKQLETMMVQMWDATPQNRPSFKSVCEQLGAECVLMHSDSNRSGQSQLTDRTTYLMNRSLKSQCKGVGSNNSLIGMEQY